MAAGSVERSFKVSADQAWDAVGDFAGVDKIFTELESLEMVDGDRVIGMMGLKIREKLVARDEAARSITYSVIDGVPLERHEATIKVDEAGDGCQITWSFDVAPDEMLPIFEATYSGALESVSKVLEG